MRSTDSVTRTRSRNLSVALTASALTLLAFACGSRTGLLGEGPIDPDEQDSAVNKPVRRLDAQLRDVQEPLPPLDAKPDVVIDQRDCKDPSETLVYTLGSNGDLYVFDPRDFSSRLIGPILCPSSSSPFSMAVDRQGVAYVVFQDGNLFRVSTRTAACAATSFVAGQQGADRFGMGFASNQGGPAETLYVSPSTDSDVFAPGGLGTIGVPSFELDLIDAFDPGITAAELTGTGDGRLFAFYTYDEGSTTFIGQVDKQTAEVVAESPVPGVSMSGGWAFAFWGGDFYTFTGTGFGNSSTVNRFRPSDGSVTQVATLPVNIVGAGVSTCSPVD